MYPVQTSVGSVLKASLISWKRENGLLSLAFTHAYQCLSQIDMALPHLHLQTSEGVRVERQPNIL